MVTETVAVLQYVADLNPGAALAPAAGTMGRFRLMEWLSFINSELHKGFSSLFSTEATMAVKEFELNRLTRRSDYLQEVVLEPYLLGERSTVADAYLFTILGWGAEVGVGIARRPNVVAALRSEELKCFEGLTSLTASVQQARGSIKAEEALQIVSRVGAKGDQRLGTNDALDLPDLRCDEILKGVVLPQPHERHQIEVSGDGVDLGNAGDFAQCLGNRCRAPGLDIDQYDCCDHAPSAVHAT